MPATHPIPLVSIITVNYNQPEVTCEFLASLDKSRFRNFEVIVVDNGSRLDPTAMIHQRFPEVTVIRSDDNLGFAGGNNLGLEKARGEYIFMVNNDTEITESLLDRLLEAFQSEKKVGMVSPKIKYFHHPDTIQYAGFTSMNACTGQAFPIGKMEKDHGQYNQKRPTYSAHGAAMMLSRKVIDEVGKMPEVYFLYYEEWDWSTQIRKAGYKILFEGNAEIFHKESLSVGKMSTLKTYYHIRNRILYMRRNVQAWQLAVFTFFLLFAIAPKALVQYICKFQPDHVSAFLRGIYWNIRTPLTPSHE
ncbi:glycosyltransferase family 2 protein [Rapidithrix thailandica]|uniref:Glycosyltransferase family 2 protein n=1 Tax=Rapidithrix thailandica TaxID=413964 RepID=A0AAW9S9Z1_9BACT